MSDEELAKLGYKDGKFVGYTIGELKRLARFDKIPVMIGSKGVEIFNAETKAGAYKKAVKKHCKEGDVSFMKMTEGVITKEVLPKLKSFEFTEEYKKEALLVAKTLAFFYIANKDPDITDVPVSDMLYPDEGKEFFDETALTLDEFLDNFFVKNKTKKIKEFKKNMFTMLRSAVFYLRFLNEPQVLFCNMEEVIEATVEMCRASDVGDAGGDIWVNQDPRSLQLLKKKNGKLLPIPTYDRKKIAADPEYKEKFLNVFETMAYEIFTKTEEAKKRYDEFEKANSEGLSKEEEEPKPKPKPAPKERDPSKRLTKAEKEYLKDNPKVVFMGTEKDTGSDEISTISYEFKGKDYELEEDTGALYREDEDGEWEFVGYRRVKEIEIVKLGKKKIKKEVYIVRKEKALEEQEKGLVHPFLNQEALDLRRELTDEEKIEKLEEQVLELQEKNRLYFDELSEEQDKSSEQFQRAGELEERLNEVEDRKRKLEKELREAITATPVEVPTEPTSEFADVSKLLKEIADLTEAREKEKGEIVKVKSLEIQIEKLERMLDNAIEEREEFATTAFELEEKLREQTALVKIDEEREKEEDDEDEDLEEDYDILKMILVSLDVDIDELLEAVKEEEDFFDFFESPGYARIVLRPVLMEIEDKDFKREDTDDEDD